MKKFYQTKWFIGSVVFLALIIIGNSQPDTSSAPNTVESYSQTQTKQPASNAIQTPAVQTTQSSPIQNHQEPVQNLNTVSTPPAPAQTDTLSNDNYYVNSDGNTVHSPAYSNTVPAGATARCGDGTYSFSQHRSGTCSHHGGVAKWL